MERLALARWGRRRRRAVRSPALAFAALLAAGTFCFLASKRRFSVKKIGIAEFALGLVMVLTLAMT
jgi:hypothetical protein